MTMQWWERKAQPATDPAKSAAKITHASHGRLSQVEVTAYRCINKRLNGVRNHLLKYILFHVLVITKWQCAPGGDFVAVVSSPISAGWACEVGTKTAR